ncbi:hypothetical protein VE03_09237 [Pseudogymnoascus sp. 23342-1-I1]|nr:hypothetical protein VE03_09237 [Pseudogymnoascus sp. 23342-1-I1]
MALLSPGATRRPPASTDLTKSVRREGMEGHLGVSGRRSGAVWCAVCVSAPRGATSKLKTSESYLQSSAL